MADRQLQLFYRNTQILHIWYFDKIRGYVVVCYYGVVIFTISLTFNLIRHRSTVNPLMFVILCFADLTMMAIAFTCFDFCLKTRESSVNYCGKYKVLRTRVHKAFFRSCRPIEFDVGGLFTVASKDFCIDTFANVILSNIIDLLLTF